MQGFPVRDERRSRRRSARRSTCKRGLVPAASLGVAAVLAVLAAAPSQASPASPTGAVGSTTHQGPPRKPVTDETAGTSTAHEAATARATLAARAHILLAPNDSLPSPPWWDGPCDVANDPHSFELQARFDGLQDCGPGTPQHADFLVRFFPGAWGELEWECVELSMRWMYLAWGVAPYPANGNGVVPNYPNGTAGYPRLTVVRNGTIGQAPQPGDVLSLDNSNPAGHTEIATSSSVDNDGNGFVTVITENDPPGATGWSRLSVSHWVVSDGTAGDHVIGWLHNPDWTLQQPVLWNLTSAGDLDIKDSGGLGGPFVKVASGIAEAEVVGGGGYDASPIVAALTTTGELEGGAYRPGLGHTWLKPIASDVASFSLSSASGPKGHPVLAWVTDAGAVEVSDGGLHNAPLKEATGATAVDLAPGSGPSDTVIGYRSRGGTFYDRHGARALWPSSSWHKVATNVSAIALAGGDEPTSRVVEAFVREGKFYARRGMTGSFIRQASDVSQIAVATAGPDAAPLLAYVSAGRLKAEVGGIGPSGYSLQATGVRAVSVSGGVTAAGNPILGALTSHGFYAEDGSLNRQWTIEARGASTSAGTAALTVS
jgi:hypothetical protein